MEDRYQAVGLHADMSELAIVYVPVGMLNRYQVVGLQDDISELAIVLAVIPETRK